MKLTHIQPFVLQKNKVGETKIYLIFYNPFGKVIYFLQKKIPGPLYSWDWKPRESGVLMD